MKIQILRSIRVVCGMSEMTFRDTPPQVKEAKSYLHMLQKRGKRAKMDKMVQLILGRKKSGELKLSPIMTEKEFNEKIRKIREKTA